jgi:uncharacterized protein YneF (UPF0154 family)
MSINEIIAIVALVIASFILGFHVGRLITQRIALKEINNFIKNQSTKHGIKK